MPSASNEIVINRPVSEVFEFLSKPENDPKWRHGILEISRTSGIGTGSKYQQVMTGPGGRRMSVDIEITDSQKDMLITFHATSGPIRPKGAYVFKDDGGNTRLQLMLEVELKGVKRLMGPMVQKVMTLEVSSLAKLKQVLEV